MARERITIGEVGRAKILEAIEKTTTEELVQALKGRKGGLRPSKPSKNGLHQFIWRWCRFHAGHDMTLPMTADWFLANWIEETFYGPGTIVYTTDPHFRELEKAAELKCDAVLKALGESTHAGALRWGRAFGMI